MPTKTFDEFKSHFFAYKPSVTEKELAICEQQYESYSLHLKDLEYFEPVEKWYGSDWLSHYQKDLNDIFHVDEMTDEQFHFMVEPSFKPESLLILEQYNDVYRLTYIALSKNYWTIFYEGDKQAHIDKTISKAELSKTVGDKIFALLNKAIAEARKPLGGRIVLDGVTYLMSKKFNNERITVSKDSPDEGSMSERIIAIMQLLIDNITMLNDAVTLNIETRIAEIED